MRLLAKSTDVATAGRMPVGPSVRRASTSYSACEDRPETNHQRLIAPALASSGQNAYVAPTVRKRPIAPCRCIDGFQGAVPLLAP